MELFPAIDLIGGCAVRLVKGDYAQKTVYSENPAEVAKSFAAAGAKYLHVVDLEGAKDGGTPNLETIKNIVEQGGLLVEVGGGIRSEEVIKKYLDAGVFRVILGTAAVQNPAFLEEMVQKYGEKIYAIPFIILVETDGFEPSTPCMSSMYSNQLSYAPTLSCSRDDFLIIHQIPRFVNTYFQFFCTFFIHFRNALQMPPIQGNAHNVCQKFLPCAHPANTPSGFRRP